MVEDSATHDGAGDGGGGSSFFPVGDYEIVEELGRGAMGVVYRARHRVLKREVALKVLAPFLTDDEAAIARFQREASAASRIRHESILPIFEVGQVEGKWFFAMELVEGRSLQDEIDARKEAESPPLGEENREDLVVFLLRYADLAEALHLAHEQQILHRDVKPSNVMVAADGGLKLVDFGLAKDRTDVQMTITGMMLGTPLYMSPEQFEGSGPDLDRRADVYSLGATLYEAVTALRPYKAKSLPDLVEKVRTRDPVSPRSAGIHLPRELEAILFKALERERERRYATAKDFAADLRNFVNYRTIVARPQGPLVRLRKRLQRNRRTVSVAIAAAAAVLLLFLLPGLIAYGRSLYASWQEGKMNREASDRLSAAREIAPEERLSEINRWLDDYPRARVRPEALLLLGRTHSERGERETAAEDWARAYLEGPSELAGGEALLALARSFLEEGRHALVREALVAPVLAEGPGRLRAGASLVAVELAIAEGQDAAAVRLIEEAADLAGDLPEEDQKRLAFIGRVAREYLPRRFLPRAGAKSCIAGRFLRPDETVLLIQQGTNAAFLRWKDGEFSEQPCPGLELCRGGCCLAAGDIDGDGVDELLHYTTLGDWSSRQHLLILSLSEDTAPRERARIPMPFADARMAVGDLDGDKRPDVAVAKSYPQRDMLAFRQKEDGSFEPMTSGALAEFAAENTDARDVAIGDLTGDGVNEVLVAAEGFHLFSALVYRYAGKEQGFVQVHRVQAGPVYSCAIADGDADGKLEGYFGLAFRPYGEAEWRYGSFLDQGVYRIALGPEGAKGEPVEARRRILFRAPSPESPVPFNFGFGSLSPARTSSGTMLAYMGESIRLDAVVVQQLRVADLPHSPLGGLALHSSPAFQRVLTADLDGDGADEILAQSLAGLTVFGLGAAQAEQQSDAPPPPPPPAGREGSRLYWSARHLVAMGLHTPAAFTFRRLWEEHGPSPEGRRALEGLIETAAARSDFSECLRLLAAHEQAFPEEARRTRFLRAHFLERSGALPEAALAFDTLATLPGLSTLDRERAIVKAAELAPWRETASAGLPGAGGWLVSTPGSAELGPEGDLVISDAGHRDFRVWSPSVWNGGSFLLDLEFEFKEIGWSRAILIGCMGQGRGKALPEGFYLVLGHSSTKVHEASLKWYFPGVNRGGHCSQPVPGPVPRGRRYRVVMYYQAGPGRIAVILTDLLTGRCHKAYREASLPPLTDGRWRLGFGAWAGNKGLPVRFRVRPGKLTWPAGEPSPLRPDEDAFGLPREYARANAALMEQRWADALATYRTLLAGNRVPQPERSAANLTVELLRRRLGGDRGDLAGILRLCEETGAAIPEVLNGREFLLPAEERVALARDLAAAAAVRRESAGSRDALDLYAAALLLATQAPEELGVPDDATVRAAMVTDVLRSVHADWRKSRYREGTARILSLVFLTSGSFRSLVENGEVPTSLKERQRFGRECTSEGLRIFREGLAERGATLLANGLAMGGWTLADLARDAEPPLTAKERAQLAILFEGRD